MLSLYVFINLVNKKSQINMNENRRLILVEAAVLECLMLANAESLCVYFQLYVLQVIFACVLASWVKSLYLSKTYHATFVLLICSMYFILFVSNGCMLLKECAATLPMNASIKCNNKVQLLY